MDRLGLRSPGTIYPVLDSLKKKELIDFETVETGMTRRKVYFPTRYGIEHLRGYLVHAVKTFCNDESQLLARVMEDVTGLLQLKHRQRVLCTLNHESIRRVLAGNDLIFSEDAPVIRSHYDMVVSFLGVGCFMGNELNEITNRINHLKGALKGNGALVIIEIEKTDNIFARVYFEQFFGLKNPPGLDEDQLRMILEKNGFKNVIVKGIEGLLFSISRTGHP
ncbi:MAG: PadR family transcriptional regulator [Candidatus Thorarchaeota archaeon]